MHKLLLAAVFCLFASITIQADPFVILPNGELAFNTSFTTQGAFTCTLCTGSGTNSVVFGSGANTVTLTFTGVNTMMLVGNEQVPALLGQIQVVASGSGFVFPQPTNPNIPLVTFNLQVMQSSPTAGSTTRPFVAFGGSTSLQFVSFLTDHIQFATGPNPPGFSYTHIVYTFEPFTIPNTNAVVDVTADLSAVPEPATVLLLSSGVGMFSWLAKRRSKRSQ
jgi:hypothetical protein